MTKGVEHKLPVLHDKQAKILQDSARTYKAAHKSLEDKKKAEIATGLTSEHDINNVTEVSYQTRLKNMRPDVFPYTAARVSAWYPLALILVGVTEWLINFATFEAKFPPALAAGLTIIVALTVAMAGHVVGAYWKQPARRAEAESKIGLGMTPHRQALVATLAMLVAALVLVVWNRHAYMSEQLSILADSNLSVWPTVIYTFLGNVIVFTLGCLISYKMHSKAKLSKGHIHLNKLKRDYNKAVKKLLKLSGELANELRKETDHKEWLRKAAEGRVYNIVFEVLGIDKEPDTSDKDKKEKAIAKIFEKAAYEKRDAYLEYCNSEQSHGA